MIKSPFSLDDPIVALASPWGESAIAIIRTSGSNCIKNISSIFKGRDLNRVKTHTMCYGNIITPKTKEIIDKVLLAVFRAPNSYTGEDSAEIFCHGSLAIIKRIISLLHEQGFRQAEGGEFTLRAFVNGKMDLTRAEAVNEIVRSRSDRARKLALSRLSGIIEKTINDYKSGLVDILTNIEVLIDYPEEDFEDSPQLLERVSSIKEGIKALLSTYKTGKIIQEGVTAAIAGRTNAGKSTLFNLLLKEDRSIVSDIHGTTRDFIDALITIEGIPIKLIDTAGLRNTRDPLESKGIEKTEQIIGNADIIIYIVDSTAGLKQDDMDFIKQFENNNNLIIVWNKIDLYKKSNNKKYIPLSAKTGQGLPELEKRITATLLGHAPVDSSIPIIDSIRQKQDLEKCCKALGNVIKGIKKNISYDLLAVDLKEAVDALGLITGEVASEDILRRMFANFCVGK